MFDVFSPGTWRIPLAKEKEGSNLKKMAGENKTANGRTQLDINDCISTKFFSLST